MNWLAQLKKNEIVSTVEATETTKRVSVVFVAPVLASMPKTRGDLTAANDPTIQTKTPPCRKVAARVEAPTNPDLWCWPYSSAMTGAEIDAVILRQARFKAKGAANAEAMAYKLVIRDREVDDRRLCLECQHLAGSRAGAWSCRNWQQAEIAIQARDAVLSEALVIQLQRCDGYAVAT